MGNSLELETMGEYPVVIIPGYGAPLYQTDWFAKQMQSHGLDTVGMKLPWLAMGDMARSAEVVAEQVRRIRETLGFEKVNFFGYSLGGLIARYYLQELEGYPVLGRGAFVAAPNSGTYFGYLGFFSAAGRQVRPGSSFIRRLNDSPQYECIAGKCLSIFVRWDGVIVPSESGYLSNGYNLPCPRPISHWRAVMNDELIRAASDFLRGTIPEGAVPGRELGMLEAGGLLPVAVSLERRARRRVWRVASSPFKSLGSKLVSLFRR